MQETVLNIVAGINHYLSDYILIVLLVGVGLYYTIRTRFVQVRCFGESMRRTFGNLSLKGKKQASGMSSFQALATAIAAQIGTGNIVGASGAILIGGPGAIFWMWIICFFGMATIYAEATLAVKTRRYGKKNSVHGGPVYYIREAFKGNFGKVLAMIFAIVGMVGMGFTGSMVQSNSIGETMQNAFGIPTWISGIVLVSACAAIYFGGVQRLASVTEKVVPIMAGLFLLGGLTVVFIRASYIPQTFAMIFKYAFKPTAILGGTFGMAMREAVTQGVKRGLFSNEAGMGSTPHAHAQANVEHPHEQGVTAIAGVFITFIVVTINAIIIISTLYVDGAPLAEGYTGSLVEAFTRTNLAQKAFGVVFGDTIGSMFVAVCLLFFAFSTIIGWNLFGRINANYLFGSKVNTLYSIAALLFTFAGTMMQNGLVWELTDLLNNLMVIPNVIALFALGGVVTKSLQERRPVGKLPER